MEVRSLLNYGSNADSESADLESGSGANLPGWSLVPVVFCVTLPTTCINFSLYINILMIFCYTKFVDWTVRSKQSGRR